MDQWTKEQCNSEIIETIIAVYRMVFPTELSSCSSQSPKKVSIGTINRANQAKILVRRNPAFVIFFSEIRNVLAYQLSILRLPHFVHCDFDVKN